MTLLALLPLLGGCSAEEGRAPGLLRDAVVGGEQDPGDPAIVALVGEQGVFCSGVAVSAHLVLTAAHCVQLGPEEVRFSSQDPQLATSVPVASTALHPDYSRTNLEHDLGALLLRDRAPQFAALPPLARDAGSVGDRVRVVGFGATAARAAEFGEKHSGYSSIIRRDETTLRIGARPASACGGDSGGPVYLQEGADERLVALTSSGDAACEQYSRAVRLDVHAAFIADISKAAEGSERSDGCSLSRAPSAGPPLASALGALALVSAFGRRRKRRSNQPANGSPRA